MASITKRTMPSGTIRYDVRWRVHGKAREKAFTTKSAAEAYKRKVEGDELAGIAVDPRAGGVTFAEYSEHWMVTRTVKGKALSPMTLQGYRGLLRRHLLPTFGTAKLRRIRPEDVRAWFSATVATSGQNQAAKGYRLLRAILNSAVDDDRIGRNPCRLKGAGIEHSPERPMLTTQMVYDLADSIDPKLRALVLLAGFGGLRTGELLGLERHDIDELHGTVQVHRQAQEVVKRGERRATRIVTTPKSEAGVRTVALPRSIMADVGDHLATFTSPDATAPVFVSRRGRGPLRRADLSEAFRAAAKAVGAPEGLRVHDLRHHAATLTARSPGVTTKELMARIGHA